MNHRWSTGILAALSVALVGAPAFADNTSLSFDGNGSGAQIGIAPLVTSQTDDMWIDVWVKWAGPVGTVEGEQAFVYNGNSGCDGWGLAVCEGPSGICAATGQVIILVGGVSFVLTNATLVVGHWQHLRATRSNGLFSLTVDGADGGVSAPSTTPYAMGRCGGDATVIGSGTAPVTSGGSSPDPFNGRVDEVRINALGPGGGLSFWHLDEGSGTTATDVHGAVMTLYNDPAWAAGHADD